MCAAPSSTSQVTSSASTKPIPKWLKMKQQNKSSADKTVKLIVQKSSSSAQKPKETRNAKRARWAKKAKPVAKAPVRKTPTYEYVSACCSVPVTKPRCGEKVPTLNPDSGKTKDKPLGLGKWHCNGVGGCKKYCKVTRKAYKASTTPSTEVPSAPVS